MFYNQVTKDAHRYVKEVEHREEGGTPEIGTAWVHPLYGDVCVSAGSIRAGLVFQLKWVIGDSTILAREQAMCNRAFQLWHAHPNIALLGPQHTSPQARLPIFSFLIRHGAIFLHHNFVAVLMNDLFGIQARAGKHTAPPRASYSRSRLCMCWAIWTGVAGHE